MEKKKIYVKDHYYSLHQHKVVNSVNLSSTLIKNNWWAKQIELYQALSMNLNLIYKKTQTKKKHPIIAVIDSGIDYLHPNIKSIVWKRRNNSNLGCQKDIYGCNTSSSAQGEIGDPNVHPFLTNKPNTACPATSSSEGLKIDSSCYHGTHVAGIIAGNYQNEINSVCPFCKVLAIKVVEKIDGKPVIYESSVLKAFNYILRLNKKYDQIIKIVNLSFGQTYNSPILSLFLQSIENTDEDILFIASAGNNNSKQPVYPAALSQVLAVTSNDHTGKKASYANFGPWVNLSAPGGGFNSSTNETSGVLSSIPGGNLLICQGTSVSAPIVSGIAGLMLLKNPKISTQALKQQIIETSNSDFLYKKNPLYKKDKSLGHGLVNALNSVQENRVSPISFIEEKRKPLCGCIAHTGINRPIKSFLFLNILLLFPLFFIILSMFIIVRNNNYEKIK